MLNIFKSIFFILFLALIFNLGTVISGTKFSDFISFKIPTNEVLAQEDDGCWERKDNECNNGSELEVWYNNCDGEWWTDVVGSCGGGNGGGDDDEGPSCGYDQYSEEYHCADGYKCWNDYYLDEGTSCEWQSKDPHYHCERDSSCGETPEEREEREAREACTEWAYSHQDCREEDNQYISWDNRVCNGETQWRDTATGASCAQPEPEPEVCHEENTFRCTEDHQTCPIIRRSGSESCNLDIDNGQCDFIAGSCEYEPAPQCGIQEVEGRCESELTGDSNSTRFCGRVHQEFCGENPNGGAWADEETCHDSVLCGWEPPSDCENAQSEVLDPRGTGMMCNATVDCNGNLPEGDNSIDFDSCESTEFFKQPLGPECQPTGVIKDVISGELNELICKADVDSCGGEKIIDESCQVINTELTCDGFSCGEGEQCQINEAKIPVCVPASGDLTLSDIACKEQNPASYYCDSGKCIEKSSGYNGQTCFDVFTDAPNDKLDQCPAECNIPITGESACKEQNPAIYYCDSGRCIEKSSGFNGTSCFDVFVNASNDKLDRCPEECNAPVEVPAAAPGQNASFEKGAKCSFTEISDCEGGQIKACEGQINNEGACAYAGGSCTECAAPELINLNNDTAYCEAGKCVNGPGKACITDSSCPQPNASCSYPQECEEGGIQWCKGVYDGEGKACNYNGGSCTQCTNTPQSDPLANQTAVCVSGVCVGGPGAACFDDNDCPKPYVAPVRYSGPSAGSFSAEAAKIQADINARYARIAQLSDQLNRLGSSIRGTIGVQNYIEQQPEYQAIQAEIEELRRLNAYDEGRLNEVFARSARAAREQQLAVAETQRKQAEVDGMVARINEARDRLNVLLSIKDADAALEEMAQINQQLDELEKLLPGTKAKFQAAIDAQIAASDKKDVANREGQARFKSFNEKYEQAVGLLGTGSSEDSQIASSLIAELQALAEAETNQAQKDAYRKQLENINNAGIRQLEANQAVARGQEFNTKFNRLVELVNSSGGIVTEGEAEGLKTDLAVLCGTEKNTAQRAKMCEAIGDVIRKTSCAGKVSYSEDGKKKYTYFPCNETSLEEDVPESEQVAPVLGPDLPSVDASAGSGSGPAPGCDPGGKAIRYDWNAQAGDITPRADLSCVPQITDIDEQRNAINEANTVLASENRQDNVQSTADFIKGSAEFAACSNMSWYRNLYRERCAELDKIVGTGVVSVVQDIAGSGPVVNQFEGDADQNKKCEDLLVGFVRFTSSTPEEQQAILAANDCRVDSRSGGQRADAIQASLAAGGNIEQALVDGGIDNSGDNSRVIKRIASDVGFDLSKPDIDSAARDAFILNLAQYDENKALKMLEILGVPVTAAIKDKIAKGVCYKYNSVATCDLGITDPAEQVATAEKGREAAKYLNLTPDDVKDLNQRAQDQFQGFNPSDAEKVQAYARYLTTKTSSARLTPIQESEYADQVGIDLRTEEGRAEWENVKRTYDIWGKTADNVVVSSSAGRIYSEAHNQLQTDAALGIVGFAFDGPDYFNLTGAVIKILITKKGLARLSKHDADLVVEAAARGEARILDDEVELAAEKARLEGNVRAGDPVAPAPEPPRINVVPPAARVAGSDPVAPPISVSNPVSSSTVPPLDLTPGPVRIDNPPDPIGQPDPVVIDAPGPPIATVVDDLIPPVGGAGQGRSPVASVADPRISEGRPAIRPREADVTPPVDDPDVIAARELRDKERADVEAAEALRREAEAARDADALRLAEEEEVAAKTRLAAAEEQLEEENRRVAAQASAASPDIEQARVRADPVAPREDASDGRVVRQQVRDEPVTPPVDETPVPGGGAPPAAARPEPQAPGRPEPGPPVRPVTEPAAPSSEADEIRRANDRVVAAQVVEDLKDSDEIDLGDLRQRLIVNGVDATGSELDDVVRTTRAELESVGVRVRDDAPPAVSRPEPQSPTRSDPEPPARPVDQPASAPEPPAAPRRVPDPERPVDPAPAAPSKTPAQAEEDALAQVIAFKGSGNEPVSEDAIRSALRLQNTTWTDEELDAAVRRLDATVNPRTETVEPPPAARTPGRDGEGEPSVPRPSSVAPAASLPPADAGVPRVDDEVVTPPVSEPTPPTPTRREVKKEAEAKVEEARTELETARTEEARIKADAEAKRLEALSSGYKVTDGEREVERLKTEAARLQSEAARARAEAAALGGGGSTPADLPKFNEAELGDRTKWRPLGDGVQSQVWVSADGSKVYKQAKPGNNFDIQNQAQYALDAQFPGGSRSPIPRVSAVTLAPDGSVKGFVQDYAGVTISDFTHQRDDIAFQLRRLTNPATARAVEALGALTDTQRADFLRDVLIAQSRTGVIHGDLGLSIPTNVTVVLDAAGQPTGLRLIDYGLDPNRLSRGNIAFPKSELDSVIDYLFINGAQGIDRGLPTNPRTQAFGEQLKQAIAGMNNFDEIVEKLPGIMRQASGGQVIVADIPANIRIAPRFIEGNPAQRAVELEAQAVRVNADLDKQRNELAVLQSSKARADAELKARAEAAAAAEERVRKASTTIAQAEADLAQAKARENVFQRALGFVEGLPIVGRPVGGVIDWADRRIAGWGSSVAAVAETPNISNTKVGAFYKEKEDAVIVAEKELVVAIEGARKPDGSVDLTNRDYLEARRRVDLAAAERSQAFQGVLAVENVPVRKLGPSGNLEEVLGPQVNQGQRARIFADNADDTTLVKIYNPIPEDVPVRTAVVAQMQREIELQIRALIAGNSISSPLVPRLRYIVRNDAGEIVGYGMEKIEGRTLFDYLGGVKDADGRVITEPRPLTKGERVYYLSAVDAAHLDTGLAHGDVLGNYDNSIVRVGPDGKIADITLIDYGGGNYVLKQGMPEVDKIFTENSELVRTYFRPGSRVDDGSFGAIRERVLFELNNGKGIKEAFETVLKDDPELIAQIYKRAEVGSPAGNLGEVAEGIENGVRRVAEEVSGKADPPAGGSGFSGKTKQQIKEEAAAAKTEAERLAKEADDARVAANRAKANKDRLEREAADVRARQQSRAEEATRLENEAARLKAEADVKAREAEAARTNADSQIEPLTREYFAEDIARRKSGDLEVARAKLAPQMKGKEEEIWARLETVLKGNIEETPEIIAAKTKLSNAQYDQNALLRRQSRDSRSVTDAALDAAEDAVRQAQLELQVLENPIKRALTAFANYFDPRSAAIKLDLTGVGTNQQLEFLRFMKKARAEARERAVADAGTVAARRIDEATALSRQADAAKLNANRAKAEADRLKIEADDLNARAAVARTNFADAQAAAEAAEGTALGARAYSQTMAAEALARRNAVERAVDWSRAVRDDAGVGFRSGFIGATVLPDDPSAAYRAARNAGRFTNTALARAEDVPGLGRVVTSTKGIVADLSDGKPLRAVAAEIGGDLRSWASDAADNAGKSVGAAARRVLPQRPVIVTDALDDYNSAFLLRNTPSKDSLAGGKVDVVYYLGGDGRLYGPGERIFGAYDPIVVTYKYDPGTDGVVLKHVTIPQDRGKYIKDHLGAAAERVNPRTIFEPRVKTTTRIKSNRRAKEVADDIVRRTQDGITFANGQAVLNVIPDRNGFKPTGFMSPRLTQDVIMQMDNLGRLYPNTVPIGNSGRYYVIARFEQTRAGGIQLQSFRLPDSFGGVFSPRLEQLAKVTEVPVAKFRKEAEDILNPRVQSQPRPARSTPRPAPYSNFNPSNQAPSSGATFGHHQSDDLNTGRKVMGQDAVNYGNNYGAVFDGVSTGDGGPAARLAAQRIPEIANNVPDTINTSSINDYLAQGRRQMEDISYQIEGLPKGVDRNGRQVRRLSTATVTKVVNTEQGQYVLIWQVGDTRAYLNRGGGVVPLTVDQRGAAANIITSALGDPNITVQTSAYKLNPGDRLILTTDGIHDNLSDAQIAAVLARSRNPEADLIAAARAANIKPDDMSVVIVNAAPQQSAGGWGAWTPGGWGGCGPGRRVGSIQNPTYLAQSQNSNVLGVTKGEVLQASIGPDDLSCDLSNLADRSPTVGAINEALGNPVGAIDDAINAAKKTVDPTPGTVEGSPRPASITPPKDDLIYGTGPLTEAVERNIILAKAADLGDGYLDGGLRPGIAALDSAIMGVRLRDPEILGSLLIGFVPESVRLRIEAGLGWLLGSSGNPVRIAQVPDIPATVITTDQLKLAQNEVEMHEIFGEKLAKGGFGIVYEKDGVVSKVFLPGTLDDPEYYAGSLREMEVMRNSEEIGLPKYYGDIVDENGRKVGYKQELITGDTMDDFSFGGKVTLEEAQGFMDDLQKLQDKLGYHGDLSGQNMFIQEVIGADGQPSKRIRFIDPNPNPNLDPETSKREIQDVMYYLIGPNKVGGKIVRMIDAPEDQILPFALGVFEDVYSPEDVDQILIKSYSFTESQIQQARAASNL